MHHKKSHKGYSDSHMKPDETCHYNKQDMGTMAKKTKLPGQMYVPKKDHNESDFAAEEHHPDEMKEHKKKKHHSY